MGTLAKFNIQLITPPAETPVTVDAAKEHERIDLLPDNANDTLIQNQLIAATRMAEEFTRRAFIPQTWSYQTTCLGPILTVPRPQLLSVDNMTFTDWQNNVTNIDANNYFIDTTIDPGRLIFKNTLNFPILWGNGWGGWAYPPGYLKFDFVAGYDVDEELAIEKTPWEIKEGILQLFGFLYENREGQILMPGSIAYELLRPFQVQYL